MKRCELFGGLRISNVVEPHRSGVHQYDYWGGHVESDEWIEEENANEHDARYLLRQSARRYCWWSVSLFSKQGARLSTRLSVLVSSFSKRKGQRRAVTSTRFRSRHGLARRAQRRGFSRKGRKSPGNSRIYNHQNGRIASHSTRSRLSEGEDRCVGPLVTR